MSAIWPFAQVSPFGPAEEIGRETGHGPHRVGQGEELLVQHQVADLLREGPEGARVGDGAGGAGIAAVRAGHHPVALGQIAQVLAVVEAQVHHGGVAVAQDAPCRRGSLHPPLVRHLLQRPAVQFGAPVREEEPLRATPNRQHLARLPVDDRHRVGVVEAPRTMAVSPPAAAHPGIVYERRFDWVAV